jgi:arylsulfatase A-like enzyme
VRAIIVMFDSLNRHMLPPFADTFIHAPNFERLAQRTVTFDNCYSGSMPCMPARREMHTGRYNFLHRSWGPLEPFDDSMPEMLRDAGVYTHLVSDHQHYWEDGGATYHTRYRSWESFRGQEGDPWKAVVDGEPPVADIHGRLRRQDQVNRQYMASEELHSQTRTFDAGVEFLETNVDADRWLLQLECFDPHEPFFSAERYKELYPHEYDGPEFDWPDYARVKEPSETVQHARYEYAALVSMCDRSLGRVLDFMDEHDMWDDTMLLVNTDHGFLLGEHGWWAKGVQPWFNELVHIPMFLWDPRTREAGQRRDALVQTIDIAPTMLSFFGVEPTEDMQGHDLARPLADDAPVREGALFGAHGGHVNVTDGRYVYMRGCMDVGNAPLEDLTLMPTRMRSRFAVEDLREMELVEPLSFTKGLKVLRVPATTWTPPYAYGTLLYDLETDPGQQHPLVDDEVELRMLGLLRELMLENDAPESQFARLGIPREGVLGAEQLMVARSARADGVGRRAVPSVESFPASEPGLTTPLAQLLADPNTARIVARHLPYLTNSEMVNLDLDASLYRVAVDAWVPRETLSALAEELSA